MCKINAGRKSSLNCALARKSVNETLTILAYIKSKKPIIPPLIFPFTLQRLCPRRVKKICGTSNSGLSVL